MSQKIIRILVTEETIYYKDVPAKELDDKSPLEIFNEEQNSFTIQDVEYIVDLI